MNYVPNLIRQVSKLLATTSRQQVDLVQTRPNQKAIPMIKLSVWLENSVLLEDWLISANCGIVTCFQSNLTVLSDYAYSKGLGHDCKYTWNNNGN